MVAAGQLAKQYWLKEQKLDLWPLDAFFCQIKSSQTFCFGLQTYFLIDFIKMYQLKGLEPKNKG